MIPRLQSWYGGDPMVWFDMPLGVLRAYATMLPRLMAERWLESVAVIQVGTGSVTKESATSTVRSWRRLANIQPPVERLSEEDKLARLGAIGVTVE